MKKSILFLLFTITAFFASAQETPPPVSTLKQLSTNTFYIHPVDSTLWQYKGVQFGWNRIPRMKDVSGSGSAGVNNFNGRTGSVSPLSSDYSSFYPLLSGSYSNPSWINGLSWSKITNAPNFITQSDVPVYTAGYGMFLDGQQFRVDTNFIAPISNSVNKKTKKSKGLFIGDSTIAPYLGDQGVDAFLIESADILQGSSVTNQAVPGNTINQQLAIYNLDANKLLYDFILVEIGLNDVATPSEPTIDVINRLQNLINTIKSTKRTDAIIVIGTMVPARQRFYDVLGPTDGESAYNKWLEVNASIMGGANAITGVDFRVNNHTIALNDGNGNLADSYNTHNDNIHENELGRQVIASEYRNILSKYGFLTVKEPVIYDRNFSSSSDIVSLKAGRLKINSTIPSGEAILELQNKRVGATDYAQMTFKSGEESFSTGMGSALETYLGVANKYYIFSNQTGLKYSLDKDGVSKFYTLPTPISLGSFGGNYNTLSFNNNNTLLGGNGVFGESSLNGNLIIQSQNDMYFNKSGVSNMALFANGNLSLGSATPLNHKLIISNGELASNTFVYQGVTNDFGYIGSYSGDNMTGSKPLLLQRYGGSVNISNLSGTGDRPVFAASDGTLKIGTSSGGTDDLQAVTSRGATTNQAITVNNTLQTSGTLMVGASTGNNMFFDNSGSGYMSFSARNNGGSQGMNFNAAEFYFNGKISLPSGLIEYPSFASGNFVLNNARTAGLTVLQNNGVSKFEISSTLNKSNQTFTSVASGTTNAINATSTSGVGLLSNSTSGISISGVATTGKAGRFETSSGTGVTLDVVNSGSGDILNGSNSSGVKYRVTNVGGSVAADDIEITSATKGVILRAPDGGRWRITVSNTGVLSTTSIP